MASRHWTESPCVTTILILISILQYNMPSSRAFRDFDPMSIWSMLNIDDSSSDSDSCRPAPDILSQERTQQRQLPPLTTRLIAFHRQIEPFPATPTISPSMFPSSWRADARSHGRQTYQRDAISSNSRALLTNRFNLEPGSHRHK